MVCSPARRRARSQPYAARRTPAMRAIRDGLRRGAPADPKVVGLLVHVGTCPLTLAEADEIGGMIAEFSRDPAVIAWTESFGELTSGLAGYRVAINAGEVWLQPSGALGLTGVHLGVTLLRGGLEKLGLDPQLSQRHEYKSAADQLPATEITAGQPGDDAADRRQPDGGHRRPDGASAVASSPPRDRGHDRGTAVGRGGPRRRADRPDRLPRRGVRLGPRRTGRRRRDPAHGRFSLRYVHRYGKRSVPDQVDRVVRRHRPADRRGRRHRPDHRRRGSPGRGGQAASDAVTARLRAAGRDPHVKAVLLRVDSPGGSYVASDAIRREVIQLREGGPAGGGRDGHGRRVRRLLRVDGRRRDRLPAEHADRVDRRARRQAGHRAAAEPDRAWCTRPSTPARRRP